jgi:hypothetical protein
MQFVTRAQWGAAPPKWRETFPRSEGVFIHYNGPAVAAPVYAGQSGPVRSFLQGIQRFHMGPQRGWPDIAYSWACDTTGSIYELRGWGVAQAATLNWNWKSHSIFLILGEGQRATDAQWAAVRTIVAEHNRRYGRGFVKGHRQAPNSTSCPGDLVIADLAAGKGNPGPTPTPPQPLPPIPTPPGVDVSKNQPKMIEIGKHVWMFFDNSPFRVRIQTPADVQAYRFMGVPYSKLSESQGSIFLRHTQAVKTG